jgi:hypothetical protein
MKKKIWIPKIGEWVTIPWWESKGFCLKPRRVHNLRGKIFRIDGGHYYIDLRKGSRYTPSGSCLELYYSEFKRSPKQK